MSDYVRSRIGQQIGNYRLTHLLGQGGFADVYLGEHIFLKTQAAIKLLRLNLSNDRMESFLNEAQTIAKLKHPHIVHVFECGIEDGTPFLVMDYLPHGTLRQRHPKGSLLPPEQVERYVSQIASALSYAHQQKLIHRDIKPENMLQGQYDQVLLSDFGLVLVAQSSDSQTTKEMAGTVPYMAPEQLHGKPRIASDQYALGIVVYEWLCGERPFNGSFIEIASQHMLTPPPSLCEKIPTLSPAIEQVVFKALAKEPGQRFKSVQAFANALTDAIEGSSTTFVSPVRSAQHLPVPSPASTTAGTVQLPAPPEHENQPAPSTRFMITPPRVFTHPMVEPGSAPADPSSQPSWQTWENTPAPRKRRGPLWGIVCLFVALLLIASSAAFLLTHPGFIPGWGPQQSTPITNRGTPAAHTQITPTSKLTTPAPKQTTPPVQSTTPASTQTTPIVPPPTLTPTQTASAGFTPNYTVIGHTVQVTLPMQINTTVSAQCASGEQMLSGGYYVSDRHNPVAESYPSAPDTWTVTTVSGYANTTLSVTVTCLQANFSAHIEIFQFSSSVNNPTTYPCPVGSTLTGGGFRDYAALAEPGGNGWVGKPALGRQTNYNYVLCATTNLLPAAAQSTTFTVPPQTSSVLQTVACSAGTQITGGGFAYDYSTADVYVNVPRGISPLDGWSVGVFNNDPSNTQTASAWAICVQVPSTVH